MTSAAATGMAAPCGDIAGNAPSASQEMEASPKASQEMEVSPNLQRAPNVSASTIQVSGSTTRAQDR
jgi:hypothetical protein